MRAFLLAVLLAAAASAEVLVLKNFTLIDGTGKSPRRGAAMIIDNGRIRWIGGATSLKAPAGAQVEDLSGKWVMPGIINLHGHVGNVVGLKQDPKNFTRENIEKNLKTYASYGVTTVASMGTEQDLILSIRDEQRRGRPAMTRVYTALQGFMYKGGYGGLPGVTYALSSASEVPKDMDELARKHPDLVKIWVDDHLGHFKHIPFDISKAVIDSAHQHGLRVAAHVFYLADAKQLAGAGVNAFVHSVRDQPVDNDLLASMKQHGVWQAASTLTREASMFVYAHTPAFADDPFFTRGVSPEVVATLKDPAYEKKAASDPDFARYPGILEMAKQNLKRVAQAGIPYGMGTDTGPPGRFPGFFEHWEMELMVEAGLTPSQVITAATRRGAEFLGARDLGTLEAGKWADLLVLAKDPLADIRNTRSLERVYIAGNKVN